MKTVNLRFACVALVLLCSISAAPAQSGPDVIVGVIPSIQNYSHDNTLGVDAFSVATTSCNIGDTNLDWFDGTPFHPVIAQSAYRLRNNRFEQVGQAWLKHGFGALQGSACSNNCMPSGSFSLLGINCSDPYGASLNGSQGGLGPKFEVNAFNGVFPWPYTGDGLTGNSVYKRLQIHLSDMDPTQNAGARYFVQAHYVTQDDAQTGHGLNNASYREVVFNPNGGGFDMAFASGSSTVQQEPAIFAWKTIDPSVDLVAADVPGEGRFWVGFKQVSNGNGTFTYNYAVFNYNSDRSMGGFSVAVPAGAAVSNIEFHDVDYHSGEPYDGADWAGSQNGGSVSWSTSSFASNPDANALRWGNVYSFSFTSDLPPGDATIDLFKPGTPTSVNVDIGPEGFVIQLPNGFAADVAPNTPTDVDVSVVSTGGTPDTSSGLLHVSVDGGAFNSTALIDLGGNQLSGTLPGVDCLSTINWYVTMDEVGGGNSVSEPSGAPGNTHETVASIGIITIIDDDFETNQGWTVTNSPGLADGAWDRGVPVGGGDRGDPATDFDGSGQCYLTDNVDGNSDVDDGSTTLTSPVLDLTGLDGASITYAFWYDNEFGGNANEDVFEIEISDNGGSTWVSVESYNANTNVWNQRAVVVNDFVSSTNQVQMRFTASDLGGGSVVEAGLDAFKLQVCPLMDPVLAAGNVGLNGGGGPHDVLMVNGSAGGGLRRVLSGLNQPLTFSMDQVPTTPTPAGFVIFGQLGVPTAADSFDIGFGVGGLVLTPCLAAPGNPFLFVLTDNFGIGGGCPSFLPSTPTPWSFTFGPGAPVEVELTLQGLVFDPTGAFNTSVTNAVIYKTQAGL